MPAAVSLVAVLVQMFAAQPERPRIDSAVVLRAAKDAQQEFERRRRINLPWGDGSGSRRPRQARGGPGGGPPPGSAARRGASGRGAGAGPGAGVGGEVEVI